MAYQKLLVAVMLTCSAGALLGDTTSATPTSTVASIDQEIQDLQMHKAQARLKAEIAGRNADRLLTEDWLGYRRNLARQEHYLDEMKEIDTKIQFLEQEKQKMVENKVRK